MRKPPRPSLAKAFSHSPLVAALALALAPTPAQAQVAPQVYTVSTNSDLPATGTLRQALTDAQANCTPGVPAEIRFTGPFTIMQSSSLPTITCDNVFINPSAQNVTLNGVNYFSYGGCGLSSSAGIPAKMQAVSFQSYTNGNAVCGHFQITGGSFANNSTAVNLGAGYVQNATFNNNVTSIILGGTAEARQNTITGSAHAIDLNGASRALSNTINGGSYGIRIADTGRAESNIINMVGANGISTLFSYGGIAILNNTVTGSGGYGIYSQVDGTISGNTISGNVTGISSRGVATISGNTVRDNVGVGISAFYGANVTGNLVSGNSTGIEVYESHVRGNFVGTIAGTNPNGLGISDVMDDGIPSDGAYFIENNVVGGNNQAGIYLASNDNIVRGNEIGFNGARVAIVASRNAYGIHVGYEATGYQITGNTISNSDGAGIYAEDVFDLDISGNFIGTDQSGTSAVPNNIGIEIRCGSFVEILGNTISGNANQGVVLLGLQGDRSTTRLSGNWIGTRSGAGIPAALPNGDAGVVLGSYGECSGPLVEGGLVAPKRAGSSLKSDRQRLASNVAKALMPKAISFFDTNNVGFIGNVIARNGGAGIRADAGEGNHWLENRIAGNVGKNIDLNGGLALPNDNLDADTGPNLKQNSPEITAVRQNANNTTTISFRLMSEAAAIGCPTTPPSFGYTYRIDFYANPAASTPAGATPLIGASTVLPGLPCGGEVTGSYTLGGMQDFISATARNEATFSSSEFSAVVAAVSAPAVTVTPASATFGPTPVGTTASRTLTLTSVGGQPWRFNTFSTDSTCGQSQQGLAKLLVPACSAPFSCDSDCTSGRDYLNGESCTLTATYSPSALANQSQTIYLCDNAHVLGGQAIVLDGSGTPTQAVTITPSQWDFGSVRVGQSAGIRSFTVLNTNPSPMVITSIDVTAPFVRQSTTCPTGTAAPLGSGQSCEVLVGFTPTAAVTSTGTLTVVSGSTGYSNGVATLTGNGTQVAEIVLPANVDFGVYTVGSAAIFRTVTFTNTGNADVVFTSITTTAQFGLTNGCGTTLAAGASCTLTLSFAPTATGTYTGTLAVSSNAMGGSGNVPLTGTAVAAPVPGVTLSATTLDLGGAAVGTTTAPGSITATSSGTAPYVVNGYGTDAACTSTASICGSGEFLCSLGCTPGLAYAPGSSCTISARFSPVTLGVRTVSFYMCDNTTASPRRITLQGEGINPTVVDVAPAAHSFGTVQVGQASAARTFTLVNSSGQPVTVQPPITTGSFRIASTNCPSSLGQGQRCTVDVVFAPTLAGNASGQLIMQATIGSARSSAIASLSGIGGMQPVLQLAQGVDFGSAQIDSAPVVRTVAIGNSGNSPLTISSVTLAGAAFALVNECGATVEPGASCSLRVTFAPVQSGEFTGTITVITNSVGGPRVVQLTARAQPQPVPIVRVTPAAMGFGDRQIGSQSASQRVAVSNVGGAPAAIDSIQLPPDYVVTLNGCGVAVAAQQTCFIEVALRPITSGARGGTMSIVTNSEGSPHTVSLNGTGCRPYTPGTRNDSRNAACRP